MRSSGRLRDARIGHGDKVSFEQRDVEFPKSWSQNATNIVAQKYFRGQLGTPARERSVKQMIGRVAGTIANWGRERGYFATAEDGDDVRGRADAHPAAPDGGVQLAGLVQRRLASRGEPEDAGERLLHPLRRGQHGVDPRVEHEGGDHLPRRLGLGDQPLEDPWLDGAAQPRRHRLGAGLVHARRRRLGRLDQVGRRHPPGGEDGRARRRPSRHPRVHLVQGQGGGQGRRTARRRLRHVDRRRRLSLDPVPEREQLGARHRPSSCARSRTTRTGT